MIKGRSQLQDAYRDEQVAREYVVKRFQSPLGALLHDRQVRAVRRVIAAESIRRAIEIAPGPARVTVDVAGLLDHVTLVDASGEMLAEARRRLRERGIDRGVRFVQADAFHLPLREKVDLVYSFRLIRHFHAEDRRRLYRQIATLLNPGGWLVFDAVNERASAPLRARAAPGEYRHFDALLDRDELTTELRECGFGIVRLIGTQHRYPILARCQVHIAPRSVLLARAGMEIVDRLGGEPLEWVVVCRLA